jgi:hypothetical protein
LPFGDTVKNLENLVLDNMSAVLPHTLIS